MAAQVIKSSGPRLRGLAKRVTVLKADPSGGVEATVVYREKGRKSGRGTSRTRPVEKKVLRATKMLRRFGSSFEKLHRRSNRKKKDGWARDFMANLLSAQGRALR
jgi:hypothetical protein